MVYAVSVDPAVVAYTDCPIESGELALRVIEMVDAAPGSEDDAAAGTLEWVPPIVISPAMRFLGASVREGAVHVEVRSETGAQRLVVTRGQVTELPSGDSRR